MSAAIFVFLSIYLGVSTILASQYYGFNAENNERVDIIVAFAMHYDSIPLKVLVNSWWEHASKSHLCLFSNTPKSRFEGIFKEAMSSGRLHLVPVETTAQNTGTHVDRYRKVLNFIFTAHESIRYVLHTDSRDVLIQADPFSNPYYDKIPPHQFSTAPLMFAKELCGFRYYSDDDCNINWLRTAFPGENFADLNEKPVSCSGTVLGPVDSVMKYLRLMVTYLRPEFEKKENKGIDQGIHNYILYRILSKPNHTTADFSKQNETFPFLFLDNYDVLWTVGCVPPVYLAANKGALQMINSTYVAPIVHQYDRFYENRRNYPPKFIVSNDFFCESFDILTSHNELYALYIASWTYAGLGRIYNLFKQVSLPGRHTRRPAQK